MDGSKVQRRTDSNAAVLRERSPRASGCGFFVCRLRLRKRQADATSQRHSKRRKHKGPMTTNPETGPSRQRRLRRRSFLKATAGTAALLGALRTNFPAGAHAEGSGPEVTKALLGYIALIDASPLVIA